MPKYIHKNAKADLETGQRNAKPLPSYKRMPHTSFTVDAFKYGKLDFCTGYFLTHFHSDHYGGLTKRFIGDIYCTRITANCVIKKLGVNPDCVHALPMNTRCLVQGVYVTFIDANHCPGAAIILFEIPHSGSLVRIVHTGDFRASDRHVSQILRVLETDVQQPIMSNTIAGCDNRHKYWKRVVPMIDYLYLDTTYLQPAHAFPTQENVIQTVVAFCRNINDDPAYLTNFLQRIGRGSKKGVHESDRSTKSESSTQAKSSLLTRWFRPKPSPHKSPTTTSLSSSLSPSGFFKRRRVLFVVGSYSIGKERLFIEIARQLKTKIYVSRDKRTMLECIGSPSLLALLANSMSEAQVHVVSMSMVNMRGMAEYLQAVQKEAAFFSSIVAFSPTGWSHGGAYYSGREQQPLVWPEKSACGNVGPKLNGSDIERMVAHIASSARIQTDSSTFSIDSLKPRGSSNKATIFPVSYSEHSSFTELARFICSLRIETVVPTVFSSDEKNKLAKSWIKHWQDLKIEFAHMLRNSTSPQLSSDRHIVPCFDQIV
ncbi:DNA cross-link repair protein PSO2/SNM1 [Coemansia guatemalensis]|uniref:DNA cross-link repair protein PSO2/SNM1 n=1 Tax=Coemansia guatemalensis TaxID=2761395 RepID=A0A9W8LQB6_9FUNG|nr:DNA cross-link repair protein PSO2/SNM1 [Coemansia guatemalensis]